MKEKISVVAPSSRWETKTIETMVIHCEKKVTPPSRWETKTTGTVMIHCEKKVTPSSRWELLTITVDLQCRVKI